jgi:hypothetical protein
MPLALLDAMFSLLSAFTLHDRPMSRVALEARPVAARAVLD